MKKLTISLTESQYETLVKWSGSKRKVSEHLKLIVSIHITSLLNLEQIQALKEASDAVNNLERKVEELKK